MLRAGSICSDVRQVDFGSENSGQLDLCFFCGFTKSLHGNFVAGQVNTLVLLELFNQILGDACVEVVAAETVVTSGCKNFDNAVADLQNGDVESAAAQIVDHDLLIIFLVQTVSKSSCRRLVDDTLYIQTGDLAGVFGRLTLCVSEVCRNRDNCFGHGLSQISFCICFQLLKDHCRDLLRSIGLVVDFDFVIGAHLTFDGRDGAVRVCNRLTFCNLSDHSFAFFGKCDDGRSGACAFCVCNNNSLAAFHNGYAAVGGSKVDANDFTHNYVSSKYIKDDLFTND